MRTEQIVKCFLTLLECLSNPSKVEFCGMLISDAPSVGIAKKLLVIEKSGEHPSQSSLAHRSWILEDSRIRETTNTLDGGWEGRPTREVPIVHFSHSGSNVRFSISLGESSKGNWFSSLDALVDGGILKPLHFRFGRPVDHPDKYRVGYVDK